MDVHQEAIAELRFLLTEARHRSNGSQLDPAAAALATADASGKPSVRTVLVTSVEEEGLVFFVSGGSGKGAHLTENPRAAMCFVWPSLQQQATLEGAVDALPESELSRHWHRRPRDMQLAAWLTSERREAEDPEDTLKRLRRRFVDEAVPCPPQWRGIRLCPDLIQFWKIDWHHPRRRVRYMRDEQGIWHRDRHEAL